MFCYSTKHYASSFFKAFSLVLLMFLTASSHGYSDLLPTQDPTASPFDQLLPINHGGAKNRTLSSKQTTFHPTHWHHAKKHFYLKWYRFFLRLQKYKGYLQHSLSPANLGTGKHSIRDYPRQNLLGAQAGHNTNLDSIVPRLWVYASIFFFWRILRMTALQSWQAMRLLLLSICTHFFLQLLLQAFRSFQLLCTLLPLFMVHIVQKVLTMPFLLLKWVKSSNNQYVSSPPDLSSSKPMRNHMPKECMIFFELVRSHPQISSPPRALYSEREAHFWLLFLLMIRLHKLLYCPLKKSIVSSSRSTGKKRAKKVKKSTINDTKSATTSEAKKTKKSTAEKGKKSTAGSPAPNPGDPSGGAGTKEGKKTPDTAKQSGNKEANKPLEKSNTATAVPSPWWMPRLSPSDMRAASQLLRKFLKSFPLASIKQAVKTLREVYKSLSPLYGEDALKELINVLPQELIEQREAIWGSLLACLTEEEAHAKGAKALSKVLHLLGIATLTKQALQTKTQQELMAKTQTVVNIDHQLLLLLNLLTLTGSLKSQSKDPEKRFQVKHNIILIAIKGGGGKMRTADSQNDQEIKNGIAEELVEQLTSIPKEPKAPSKDKNEIPFVSLTTYITLNLISEEEWKKHRRENQKKYRENVKSAGYQKSTEKAVGKIKKAVESITHKNHRLNITYDRVYAFLCFLSVQGILKGQRLTGWKYLIDVITLSTETIHQGPRENLPAIFDPETHRKLSELLLRLGFDLSQWGSDVEKLLRRLVD